MQQAECKGQGQGAGDAATSDQGTGASQPKASPAPDLDDLANLMSGLDSRGKAVIGPDVSIDIINDTKHVCISMHVHMYVYIYVPMDVLLQSNTLTH